MTSDELTLAAARRPRRHTYIRGMTYNKPSRQRTRTMQLSRTPSELPLLYDLACVRSYAVRLCDAAVVRRRSRLLVASSTGKGAHAGSKSILVHLAGKIYAEAAVASSTRQA